MANFGKVLSLSLQICNAILNEKIIKCNETLHLYGSTLQSGELQQLRYWQQNKPRERQCLLPQADVSWWDSAHWPGRDHNHHETETLQPKTDHADRAGEHTSDKEASPIHNFRNKYSFSGLK